MKKRLYLFIVILMLAALLGALPAAPTAAAPEAARTSTLTVGSWNLDDGLGTIGIQFAAYDINWQVLKAASLEFGYIYCVEDICTETVDVTLTITKKNYPYPQDLDLEADATRIITPSTLCTIEQFVRILDAGGAVKKEATHGPYNYCLTIPYPLP
jgi:hypothetical protein